MPIFIFLTILFSPLYIIRWSYFGVLPTTLLELLLCLTILIWLILKVRERDFSWPRTVFDLPILLLLIAATIGLLITPDLRGGLGVWKAYFVEPILFYYVVVSQISRLLSPGGEATGGQAKLLIYSLVGAALWVSVLGLLQVVLGLFIITPHQTDRAHAVFNNGNALALFAGPIIFLLLGSLINRWENGVKESKGNFVGIAILIVLVITLFLTKSTGGLVGFFAGLMFFLKKPILSYQSALLVFLGMIGVFLLFMVNISRFVPQIENPWQRLGDTVSVRFCLWEGTRNLLLDRPIFGAGLAGFKELYSSQYYTCDAEALEYPHNWILNLWTETGLLGLIAFVWLLGSLFHQVLKVQPLRRLNLLQGSILGLTAAVIYWLVHGLVDVPYFKNDLALEFWTIMALVAAIPLASASEHPPEAPN